MAETKVISFHGKQEVKDMYVARVKAHHAADEIIKGKYWEKGKGCAVGCTVHSADHDAYTTELGISWRLALVEDSLFENMPNDQAKEWPIQFLEAIPVGVDTEIAFKNFIIWNLADQKEGLIQVLKKEEEKVLMTKIVNLYKESFTREIQKQEWEPLYEEAEKQWRSAYASASAYAYAYAYAYASAFCVLRSAYAYASAYASASASAYASAYAYAYATYGSQEWTEIRDARILRMRDKLLEFLKELK